MLFYLFLLFTLVPLVEVVILIQIGQATEWWVPILLVIATGILGAALARWQGWQAVERIRADAREGRMPAGAIIDGVLILAAGVLLVTPGILTDLVGFGLLIPPLRGFMKRGVAAWIRRNFEVRVSRMGAASWQDFDVAPNSRRDEIVDAKVLDMHVEDADAPARRPPR
jgi:UPF0716 protein FxsA